VDDVNGVAPDVAGREDAELIVTGAVLGTDAWLEACEMESIAKRLKVVK
jgi:hypothetical protein